MVVVSDAHTKRAALFEYFKTTNAPKWASDGARLFKTLAECPDAKIDQMHARMIQFQEQALALKAKKEKPMYKRWKMPLAMLLMWGTFATLEYADPKVTLNCIFCAFIAGTYFQELLDNTAHNYVEYKNKAPNDIT